MKQQVHMDVKERAVQPEDDTPPPLPIRPNFEGDEEEFDEDFTKEESQQEKNKKGSNILKTIKKHIRQKSDGSQAEKQTEDCTLVQTSTSSEPLDGKASKPIKAYLITDIVGQPSTKMFGEPEMYEPADIREEESVSKKATDLLDGWQEVKDKDGTYYWHIDSGRTQRQKPKVTTALLKICKFAVRSCSGSRVDRKWCEFTQVKYLTAKM